ncbi:MAG: type II toxin-antitoxin system YafQ family toxin [Lentisphaeria bacterium]|nr:type II toxin-antitoxin system YafQ family toxin [Lentisphaeria bacterium]
MSFTIKWSSRFKKQYKLMMSRGENIELLDSVIRMLAAGQPLPPAYHDHILTGDGYTGFHECHIRPDWLLIYDYDENILVLTLFRTGSHSDLFG